MVVQTKPIREDKRKSRPNAQARAKIRCFEVMKFCLKCGEDDPFDMEAHHIKKRADGGNHSLKNLCTLCWECHDEWHDKFEKVGVDFLDWLMSPLTEKTQKKIRMYDFRCLLV